MHIKGRFTPQEINELAKRYKDGQSMAKISREIHRTEDSIKKHLIRLGIFRPLKINKIIDIYDDQSFVSKYLKIRLSFLFIILTNSNNFDGYIPSFKSFREFSNYPRRNF